MSSTRLLSGEPALKLANLLVTLVKLLPQPVVQTLSAEEKSGLQRATSWCRTQCVPLQKKLKQLQAGTAKAARLLQFTEALEREETEMTEARQRWYDNQRYTAQTPLEKWGRYQQLQLEVKIALLQREAEMYEAHLEGL